MLLQVDIFAPITTIGQSFVGGTTVHPLVSLARFVVMISQGKMWRAIAKRLAQCNSFSVKSIRDPSNSRLGAFVVDIPSIKVLKRTGIHQNQRWMNNGPRVHQRPAQRILAGLDRVCLGNSRQGHFAVAGGKHTGG